MHRSLIITAVVVVALIASGCRIDRARHQFRPISRGTTPPGVELIAEDGSFHLAAGAAFRSPFGQGDGCVLAPTAESWPQGLATGARPVRVQLADGRHLYGLLSLCGAPPSATGPATSSYQIEVPESRIAATSGGRISMAREYFSTGNADAAAWILWLSETSFTQERPAAGAVTARTVVGAELDRAEQHMTVARWSAGLGVTLSLVGAVMLMDGEGPSLAFGAGGLLLGGTSLIMWPIFYGSAKTSEQAAHQLVTHDPRAGEAHRGLAIDAPSEQRFGLGVSGRF